MEPETGQRSDHEWKLQENTAADIAERSSKTGMRRAVSILWKIIRLVLILFLIIILYNVLEPLLTRNPDQDQTVIFSRSDFEAGEAGDERIRCIDDNEEALLWRLRMIGSARESIVLATFDLRPDESGMDVMAALFHAAEKGVKVKLLVDGIYELPILRFSDEFHALAAHENVEARIYNPISPASLLRVNYRMHDKYLMIDDEMYLLGGRNTNDIFLGDYQEVINIDRDILVVGPEREKGSSFQELEAYFAQIWDESCVKEAGVLTDQEKYEAQKESFCARYEKLKETYGDMETYGRWQQETEPAAHITLISNGTQAGKKSGKILQMIRSITADAQDVTIQTPYAICNKTLYQTLKEISTHADLKIIVNAVEKGSNPWGCTDYLNHRQDLLDTGASMYELMNEQAVHTKTIVADQNLSITGSYNLDMRSTYLDTELMLVIDSEELNAHIRTMNKEYMAKSREVLPDGTESEGALYQKKEISGTKGVIYQVLRVVIRPFRHLL